MKNDTEMSVTNRQESTIGINNTTIEIERSIMNGDIQFLSFNFYQLTDTSHETKIVINCVTKKDVMDLAKKLKLIANSFSDSLL